MICPECKTSRVFVTSNNNTLMTTDMNSQPQYDLEGWQHIHDSSSSNVSFSWACSNGHEGIGKFDSKCWCGWIGNSVSFEVNKIFRMKIIFWYLSEILDSWVNFLDNNEWFESWLWFLAFAITLGLLVWKW